MAGGVLQHNPITIHPHPLDATMTNMQSAFHLGELPLGGRQTSPEPLRVCSSHPCRAVSLTQAGFIISVLQKPAEWKLEMQTPSASPAHMQTPEQDDREAEAIL